MTKGSSRGFKKAVMAALKESAWKCPRCGSGKCLVTSCPEYLCSHTICLECKYHDATHPLNPTPLGYVPKKV